MCVCVYIYVCVCARVCACMMEKESGWFGFYTTKVGAVACVVVSL